MAKQSRVSDDAVRNEALDPMSHPPERRAKSDAFANPSFSDMLANRLSHSRDVTESNNAE